MAQVTAEAEAPGRGSSVRVEWGLTPVHDFPQRRSGGFARNTELHDRLKQIQNDPTMHGQVYEIGTYDDPDVARARRSASAKATDLRKNYKGADGWEFRVGDSQAVGGCTGLFARYDS